MAAHLTLIASQVAAQIDTALEAKADNAPASVAKEEVVTNKPGSGHDSVRVDGTGVHVSPEEPSALTGQRWRG